MTLAHRVLTRSVPPSVLVAPEQLDDYQRRGYLAQPAYAGARTLVSLRPQYRIRLYTRVDARVRAAAASGPLLDDLGLVHAASGGAPLILDGVLVGGREPTYIITDLLMLDGRDLSDERFIARYTAVDELLGSPPSYEQVTGDRLALARRPKLWLAPLFVHSFAAELRSRADSPRFRGLVLRRPEQVVGGDPVLLSRLRPA
jgi:hypothetical protein